ncbi:MAG TPA: PEGA domain-containing protein, partial [Vicinamibacterales bacterium]|nr:PEGA domain-containing protein [Vicinamibacterales bacterium]
DLTLNAATSADVGTVPDLRLDPDVDTSSTLRAEDMPLEQRDSVPPGTPTLPESSRVDIFIPDEVERPWFSRLLSLKTRWEKKPQRSAQDEPVTIAPDIPPPAARTVEADQASLSPVPAVKPSPSPEKEHPPLRTAGRGPVTPEAISNLERHLASLAAFRDVWASIDQRLARVEEASGRVEAAVQRTEAVSAKSRADSMLPGMSANIEKQLAQAEMARTEQAVADRALHELCQNIDARLARTEDTLHRSEGVVTERIQELSARTTARIVGIEETLRLAPQSVADSMLPTIERQITQAREALERTEDVVADKTLHELYRNIDARLERTEDRLHRSEGVVAEWLQQLSARMTARLTETEETIQRIERIVSSRPIQQTASQHHERPLGAVAPVVELRARTHASAENRKPTREDVRARAALFLSRFANIKETLRPIQLPWVTGLAAPVLVLVAALAIGSLFRTERSVAPQAVAPVSTADRISAPVAPAVDRTIDAPSPPAVMANAPRSTRERLVPPPEVSAPEEQSRDQASAPATNRGPRYVGTLSITSVPSGASVSINGTPVGKTPLRLPRQRAGSLAVQIAHDGFERWSAAVLVPADRLTQVTATLRATPRAARN